MCLMFLNSGGREYKHIWRYIKEKLIVYLSLNIMKYYFIWLNTLPFYYNARVKHRNYLFGCKLNIKTCIMLAMVYGIARNMLIFRWGHLILKERCDVIRRNNRVSVLLGNSPFDRLVIVWDTFRYESAMTFACPLLSDNI